MRDSASHDTEEILPEKQDIGGQLITRALIPTKTRTSEQLQALLHGIDRYEECGRDFFLGQPFLAQRQKGTELVERMQRRALEFLGERVC